MTAPLLSLQGLCKHYPLGTRLFHAPQVVRAVQDITLRIWPGQNLGLVGESGCGKSTLGRTVLRLIEPTQGQILMEDTDVTALSSRELRRFRRRAQMIFQDPYSSLNPRMNVGQILREPLQIHALCATPAQQLQRAEELLEQVGLPTTSLSRYPHEFSGGQRQRIGIARALAVQPQLIIADEPVSALDVSIQAQIINLLLDVQAQQPGLTYLFVSHDLKVVEHMCHRVAVMYLGRLAEVASTQALYRTPRHPYTQALLASVPRPPDYVQLPQSGTPGGAPRKKLKLFADAESPSLLSPPSGCAFHPRCLRYHEAGKPERCRSEVPALRTVTAATDGDDGHQVACHLA